MTPKTYLFAILIAILFSSCRKEEPNLQYDTSYADPSDLYIQVFVSHELDENEVKCKVILYEGGLTGDKILLDPSSFFKFDGLLLNYFYSFYRISTSPAESHLFRYHDYHGTMHMKEINKPDSLYFVNIPDQIDASQDLILQLSGEPLIDYDYAALFIRDEGDVQVEYYNIDSSNSTIYIPANTFQANSTYKFKLKRSAFENDKQFFEGHLDVSVESLTEFEITTY